MDYLIRINCGVDNRRGLFVRTAQFQRLREKKNVFDFLFVFFVWHLVYMLAFLFFFSKISLLCK